MTPIVLDGATGTEIERLGLPLQPPLWSAQALIDDPALVRSIHRAYAEAGAQVLTSSSSTHARNLGDLAHRAAELTTLSVRLARDARDAHARASPRPPASASPAPSARWQIASDPTTPPAAPPAPSTERSPASWSTPALTSWSFQTMGRVDEARAAVAACQDFSAARFGSPWSPASTADCSPARPSPTSSPTSPTSSCRPSY